MRKAACPTYVQVAFIWTSRALRESQHGPDASFWPDSMMQRFFYRAHILAR
jgi:hypothetical protein